MRPVDQLREALSRLPRTEQTVSRFGSARNAAWSVSGREFAHLHADHRIDLRLPREIQSALRNDARARFRKSRSEWVEVEFHTADDVEHVARIAREAWAAADDRTTAPDVTRNGLPTLTRSRE